MMETKERKYMEPGEVTSTDGAKETFPPAKRKELNSTKMIEASNLVKNFGKLKALDNISVNLHSGEAIALIGPNGSGKTTFIKAILGIVIPDKGEILFDGKSILKDWTYRNKVGYMPQIGRYPDNMSIEQVFEMMKDIRKPEGGTYDEDLIKAFQMKDLLRKKMNTLSGGTRQKVSSCIAFLFNPKVLILDEPTAGLDPLSSEILKEKIVEEQRKGKLILITSHVLSELEEITSNIMYLMEGKIRFYKEISVLKEETGEEKLVKAIAAYLTKAKSEL